MSKNLSLVREPRRTSVKLSLVTTTLGPTEWVKRSFDLSLGLAIAALCLPLIALIAICVRFTSPGPVFFSHQRIGRGGRAFRAWKFRTMIADADAALERMLAEDPALRAEWRQSHKLKRDPRVTRVGALLRQSSLDELPQLWNVLWGEMSLVGPRPIVEAEVPEYRHEYELYQRVRPGMTGMWQVSGRNDTSYAERVRLDAYYVRHWSVWLDLYILTATVRVVLLRSGAY
jgi:Undecaprenyl-phosphate galactose phosphotransferase WbaP